MASLRKASNAAARPPSQAVDTRRQPLPGNAAAKNDARKSRVGDKIRRRMSMRYATGSDDFASATPPIPGLPGLPGLPSARRQYSGDSYQNVLEVHHPPGLGGMAAVEEEDDDQSPYGGVRESGDFRRVGGPGRTMTDERIGRRAGTGPDGYVGEEWDLEELGKDGIDINQYIKKTLMGADENEKKRFQAALEKQKQSTAKELQRNVFKHYAEFVSMSKEIATLENDMLELKELLGQWKDLPQLMGMEDSLAPTLDKDGKVQRRRTQRNSIADLQQLYKAQLTSLWSTVEGSQKYLPLVPGRHLVYETHTFLELNAATYKAKQNVSLFLLNDLLLIAGRRRMKTQAGSMDDKERNRGRMVAERCWVLADLVVVDVKDSGDLTNALKIRRGKENTVYRTAKVEDKKALLAAFRQVSQELSEKKRKESEKEQQRRKSMWQGDTSSPQPGLLSPTRPQSVMGMTMSDSKDLRWVDDYGDELTMAIAMRDWDEAVKQVEKGNTLLEIAAPHQAAKELLESRLEHLQNHLVNRMLHDLSAKDVRKSSVCRLVALLSRVNAADQARDAFLKARRDIMLTRVRGIRCEGDTSIYINELAIVCFTIIRHTGDWYMTAFKDYNMASGFVSWAKEQIESFGTMFRRQVFIPTVSPAIADECLKVVASNNRRLLRDVGLDFTFLLSSLLNPDPSSPSSAPHPSFDLGSFQTPGPHLPTFNLDTPEVDLPEPPYSGSTAPLSITPRSPRRPRMASGRSSESSKLAGPPESPAPPPRSGRRAISNSLSVGEDEGDSLR